MHKRCLGKTLIVELQLLIHLSKLHQLVWVRQTVICVSESIFYNKVTHPCLHSHASHAVCELILIFLKAHSIINTILPPVEWDKSPKMT